MGFNAGYAKIENCYSFGSLGTGGAITGSSLNGTNVTLINCYGANASGNSFGNGELVKSKLSVPPSPALTNCNFGNGSVSGWNHTTATTIIDDDYDSENNLWIKEDNFDSGYGLTVFKELPWNSVEYLFNTSEAKFGDAGGVGDPHITTIYGVTYDLVTKEYFNLFDNISKKNRLIINAQIKHSEYPIWKNKEYIYKIAIMYKNYLMVIEPGFRGKEAKIIYTNTSFNIYSDNICIENKQLSLIQNHKRFCADCKYRSRNRKLLMRHRRNESHKLLSSVRNEIKIVINDEENTYYIRIQNVDKDNFNPASIKIKFKDLNKANNYKGAIINIQQPYSYDIDNLFNFMSKHNSN